MAVRLAGPLDIAAAAVLQELLTGAVSERSQLTILDLSDVDFIDCHCVGLIIAAWNTARARGGSLRVEGLRGEPERVFDVLGLRSSLTTCAVDDEGGQDDRDFRPARQVA